MAFSMSDGAYRLAPALGDDAGTVESDLTGVYPYARIDLNARVSAWALAGAGSGTITLNQAGGRAMETDLSLRMGAVGVKGQVLDGSGASGLALNVKSDAMWVGTKSAKSDELSATEGDVTRLRVTLQGERTFESESDATFTPERGGGLAPRRGRRRDRRRRRSRSGIALHRRKLERRGTGAHARRARGLGLRGVGGERRHPGDPERIRPGMTLSIAPEWGHTGSATERLWSARDARELDGGGSEIEPGGRLVVDAGTASGSAPAAACSRPTPA